ncbi:MAG TPA: hypothetical protein VK934_01350 [Fimbriimonas sp.]|nr:hypothetical protein [Fimbriimonas sp.]
MNTVSRYYTLGSVAGVLAVLLLIAAIFLRIVALVSGVLVLLLLAAAIYFFAKGSGLKARREPPHTRAT